MEVKRDIAIVKVNEDGIVTYLTSAHKLGELTYSFTENVNFAYVFKNEREAWDFWNELSNNHDVKKVAGVETRVIGNEENIKSTNLLHCYRASNKKYKTIQPQKDELYKLLEQAANQKNWKEIKRLVTELEKLL